MSLGNVLLRHTFVPVVTIDRAKDVLPLCDALLAGGIGIIEITLRDNASLHAMELAAKEHMDMLVGAGTVTSVKQLKTLQNAGAEFFVSPGLLEPLAREAIKRKLLYIPGVSTVSDVMLAESLGFSTLKFFPAELCGGLDMLLSFATLFPHLSFCPDGGIEGKRLMSYLSLSNVTAVAGSFVAPRALIKAGKWDTITANAKRCCELIR